MKTYQEWNYALASYFSLGATNGSRIYLSIDGIALDAIGHQHFESEPEEESWREDFVLAVRKQVIDGEGVDLTVIQGFSRPERIPNCVAFLGFLVLAAYDMASEEDISEKNYFQRLRSLLGLNQYQNRPRPKGMEAGSEENFWKIWNQWLIDQDYIPTAQRGRGSNKFIHYPISQCLLRQADWDRLEKYFYEHNWTNSWDAQTLFSRLREKTQQFPEYLRNLIKNSGDRYEVLTDAIHEVHQKWLEAGCPETNKDSYKRASLPSPNLFAGLYRTGEDYEIEYYVYPKEKPQQRRETIHVEIQGQIEQLENDRSGWYLPIGNLLGAEELNKGIRYKIIGSEYFKTLQFPVRDFWILLPDPEEPNAGTFATWHIPRLGQPFILLCKQRLMKDLNLLKDERLVKWSDEVKPFSEKSEYWIELHNFQVLSQTWQGVFIDNWELKDALQPKVRLSISLSEGLQVPNQKAWLQGHSPSITIFGFMKSVELEILKLPSETPIKRYRSLNTNQAYSLELSESGSYLIRATRGDNVAETFLRIVDWNSLQLCDPKILSPQLEKVDLSNGHKLCGAILQ